MREPYIRPFGKPIREPLWKRVTKWLATVAVMTACAVGFAVVVLEWMAGCGETYIDAKGERHEYECLFIKR